MTQTPEQIRTPPPLARPAARRSPFRHTGIVVLTLLVALFFWMSLPLYLGLDPAQSMIPISETFVPHYALLVAHIGFGSIAIVTLVLQVWPWLRRRHPAVHRVSGRLYVFAGIGPSALLSMAIMPFGMLEGAGALGSSIWAVLTLAVTTIGYQKARQRDWAAHRRFMIYSFALTTSILTGRLLFNGAWYGGLLIPGFEMNVPLVAQIAGFWLNWVINLAVAAWWVRRTAVTRVPA